MKTDRELLELAAKAVGYIGFEPKERPGEGWVMVKPPGLGEIFHTVWAPLTSSGAALRLAVELRIAIEIGPNEIVAGRIDKKVRVGAVEDWTGDLACDQAATRRAIVRAAAQIGKSLP